MIIYFRTKKLQKVCSNTKSAKKEYGHEIARKLQQRLMELKAASCLDNIHGCHHRDATYCQETVMEIGRAHV